MSLQHFDQGDAVPGAKSSSSAANDGESIGAAPSIDRCDLLKEFYKEAGREVTLAYTTLNQMKNWAIVIVAAACTFVASFMRGLGHEDANNEARLGACVAVAAVVTYVFVMRFFVRAMLCYVNLLRWNEIQRAIVSAGVLLPREETESAATPWNRMEQVIQDYYYGWNATEPRTRIVTSCLKLGFGPLFGMTFLAVTWSASVSGDQPVVRGAIIAAILGDLGLRGLALF